MANCYLQLVRCPCQREEIQKIHCSDSEKIYFFKNVNTHREKYDECTSELGEQYNILNISKVVTFFFFFSSVWPKWSSTGSIIPCNLKQFDTLA